MEALVEFFGLNVPAGKAKTVKADINEDTYETLHLTQIALGDKPAKGPHTVFIESDEGKFAIGTLNRDNCCQVSLDVTITSSDLKISHTGGSEISVTGYRALGMMAADEEYDSDEDGPMFGEEFSSDEEGEEDEEESEDDEEEAPRAVPLLGKRPIVEDEADESSDEDGEGGEKDDSSSEEEESDSEDDIPVANPAKRKQAAAQTPQPAKKAKAEVGKVPASAPAKVTGTAAGGSPAAPKNEQEYIQSLRAFLAENGATKLGLLGGKVKRPAKAPKLKAFIAKYGEQFAYNDKTDMVSLAK